MTDQPRTQELIVECRRQEESCLYSSTIFYIWLRRSRFWHRAFIIAPIVLGALATWSVLDQPDVLWVKWLTATFALLAGLLPAIYQALKLDVHIDEVAKQAAEFKNLQDRFRQAAHVTSLVTFENFKAEFDGLMQRLEAVRSGSLTPPERYLLAARMKIEAGDYSFDVDTTNNGQTSTLHREGGP